ncbi:MAG: DNRLRE domain-containing protein, partial [Candidatus Thorarchaeota archaeon]|nr:DNRLRE domain-containing protein [Candidatus Thorarchaeota archaeon]
YYYKVHAQNTNSAGSSDDTIGPSSILVNAFWKIHPTDDAYTVEEDYYGNYGDEPELKVRDYQGYCRYSWLKFSIENPEVVKSAMLCVRISDVESNGHGTIRAYSTATSWTEDTISESNAPLFGDWIADDSSGTAGSWDYWDISNFANSANTISIRLLCQSGINEGATYYSKEYSTVHYRPYLVVEYWGAPQDPIMVTGSEANSFVDEHFNNPDLDTEAWISHSYSPDTEWDYDIVREGLSYYEGTVLKFQDSVIAQHSEWRGYYFEQEHLDIRNAFRFETKLGWALDDMDSPAVQLGVELLDEEGFTITSIYFDYGGYWGNYAYIHGDIGATSNSWSTELYPPVITSPHDAMFEIERDLEGNIVLTYWKVFAQGSASYPYEIHTGTDTRNVNTVRLFCREKTPYDYAYSFSAWFDSIKETRKTTLGNPESIAPFTNPIEEQSFNSQLTKWFNPSGGAPIGSLISSVAIDGNAWHVNIDNDEWAIYQSLNGDRNDFKFAAIENKRVSFTFFALRDNSDSRVCAMIKYTSPGDREPKVVVGDWVLLANDGEWQQVAVTTTWRLPPNIESLEVWIIGEALLYNDFSAVIDESRLVIINDDIISQEHNYDATHGGECGIVSVNLATVYAQKPDGWSVKVIPIVVAQAASGFYISKISIDFAVSHGIADIAENG